jgi:hypothetical protein
MQLIFSFLSSAVDFFVYFFHQDNRTAVRRRAHEHLMKIINIVNKKVKARPARGRKTLSI